MSELGTQIAILRKAKGLSQESLADAAKISLRTLQRIEKEENNPQGETIQRLAGALHVTLDELLDFSLEEDYNYIRAMHFSTLIFVLLPLGNIILPLIFWLRKKGKIKYLSSYAKHLLNFQITWTILVFFPMALIMLIMRNSLSDIYNLALAYPAVLYGINFFYTLMVGLLIHSGDKNYFPVALRFII